MVLTYPLPTGNLQVMNKLKHYINSLSESERDEFAKDCGTSIGYIRKILSSDERLFFGPALCRKLEDITKGMVTRQELRPRDWHEIWPELAQQEQKKKEEAA